VDENQIRYTTLALFLGLYIGASFWGTASDVVGRRLAFNFTLFIAGTFGLAAGGGPNWVRPCRCPASIAGNAHKSPRSVRLLYILVSAWVSVGTYPSTGLSSWSSSPVRLERSSRCFPLGGPSVN
jgi:MFS family permease